MAFITNVIERDLTGATAEVIELNRGFEKTQITISDRATGTIAIKVKGFGGDVFTDTDPALSMNLANDRTASIMDAVDALEFTASAAGAYKVTVLQTLST